MQKLKVCFYKTLYLYILDYRFLLQVHSIHLQFHSIIKKKGIYLLYVSLFSLSLHSHKSNLKELKKSTLREFWRRIGNNRSFHRSGSVEFTTSVVATRARRVRRNFISRFRYVFCKLVRSRKNFSSIAVSACGRKSVMARPRTVRAE